MQTNDGRSTAVESSPLWTAVTLSGVNRFSGAIRVTSGRRAGAIYFEGGRVIHAEAGDLVGEPAFQQILRWPDAGHTLNAGEAAAQVTITRGLALLLVDASAGAARTGTAPGPAAAGGDASRTERLIASAQQIRQIPGVMSATLAGRDGPIGHLGPRTRQETEATALGRLAMRLGQALGLGRGVAGVAQGAQRLVLLLATKEHQLTILVRAEGQVEAVQAKIRAIISPQT